MSGWTGITGRRGSVSRGVRWGMRKFVVRSAYGIFYNVVPGYQAAQLPQNPPFRTVQLFEALPGNQPSLTMANPFPGTGTIPANPSVNAWARDHTTGYMQEWNFTLEGEVLRNTALRASYVGNKGTHLDRNININDPVPAPGLIQPRRPYQPFGTIAYRESGRNSITKQMQLGALQTLFRRGFRSKSSTHTPTRSASSHSASRRRWTASARIWTVATRISSLIT